MSRVTAIPSLDQIANGAVRHLADLDTSSLCALLEQCAGVQAVLASALLRQQAHQRRVSARVVPDKWLTPEAAAKLAKLSARFFFRHSPPCACDRCRGRVTNGDALGFIKRVSHRSLRVSKLGLEAWLKEARS